MAVRHSRESRWWAHSQLTLYRNVYACRYFTSCLCVYFDAVRQKKKLKKFLHLVSNIFFSVHFLWLYLFLPSQSLFVCRSISGGWCVHCERLYNVEVYFVQRSNDKLDTELLKAWNSLFFFLSLSLWVSLRSVASMRSIQIGLVGWLTDWLWARFCLR